MAATAAGSALLPCIQLVGAARFIAAGVVTVAMSKQPTVVFSWYFLCTWNNYCSDSFSLRTCMAVVLLVPARLRLWPWFVMFQPSCGLWLLVPLIQPSFVCGCSCCSFQPSLCVAVAVVHSSPSAGVAVLTVYSSPHAGCGCSCCIVAALPCFFCALENLHWHMH